jgi:hypothetical protein
MREMRMQTLHAVRRTTAHPSGTVESMQRVTLRDVLLVRRAKGFGERLVVMKTFVEVLHTPGCFEPPDGFGRPHACQPIERRERIAVDEGMRLDDGRKTARTPVRDAYVTA